VSDVLQKIAAGLILVLLGQAGVLWADVLKLNAWRQSEWPLEKQLLLLEREQLRARISLNEMSIRELEIEMRNRRP
jgi:hypothetical protein